MSILFVVCWSAYFRLVILPMELSELRQCGLKIRLTLEPILLSHEGVVCVFSFRPVRGQLPLLRSADVIVAKIPLYSAVWSAWRW